MASASCMEVLACSKIVSPGPVIFPSAESLPGGFLAGESWGVVDGQLK